MSPTIFNIVVDAILQATSMEVCGPQEAQLGLGWVSGDHDNMFYANNGCITGKKPIWLQDILMKLMWMFERFVLYMNLVNTKAMNFTPGFIWYNMFQFAYNQRATG